MKSLAELAELREKLKIEVNLGNDATDITRVVVGMATCGIAAGARPVLDAMIEEVEKQKAEKVQVVQTGCIGICKYEPVVEVYVPGQEKVTYIQMTPEKVAKVVSDHLINGQAVAEYTIGAVQQ